MQFADVNVLIYAHREDAAEHSLYAAWLKELAEGDEPFAVAEVVLASFLRIVTNAKIFDPPTPMKAASPSASNSSSVHGPLWSRPAGGIGISLSDSAPISRVRW